MKISIILHFLLTFGFFTFLTAFPGKIISQFPAPGRYGTGMTFDGKNLWVADHQQDKLFCIDPQNGVVKKEIPAPGFWPMGLAWDGKNLWNVDSKQNKIFKIDSKTGHILATIEAPSDNPEGLVWDGQTLWVSDAKDNSIMKLDLSDGTALLKIKGPARSVQGLTYDGQYLWCSDRLTNEIYMIRPEDGEIILLINSPAPYPRGLAFDGENLWNIDYQTDSLYQLTRRDDDLFRLEKTRKARITYTHEVKAIGNGKIIDLDVYIAVPEELNQQKISLIDYYPASFSKVKDRWNQQIAHFRYGNISSDTKTTTKMVVEAEISAITYFIYPDGCGTLSDIPSEIRKLYTADGSKYLLQDLYIQNLVKEIVGDEKNPYWIARKIFDYVRLNMEYKLEGGWNVAPYVLKRGTGSCSEYTFSFIALCRAAGLPARYVGAVVVRGDDASLDEVFHRWPEVYLPNYGWIPIDPQGGDKDLPRNRILNIGHLSNRFLITTQGGGDSEYLGWYYNSHEKYLTDPQVEVNVENFGDWDPVE